MAFVLEEEGAGRFVLEPEAPAPQGNIITRGYKAVAEPLTSGVATILRESSRMEHPAIDAAARDVAEMAVPQTPLEAGAAIGTGGAGLATRGLSRGLQILSRITGGIIGGEAGGQVSGEPTGKGALIGGGGAAAGEGLGAALSWLVPRLPGGRAAANAADTENIGKRLPPALGQPKTATDMWEAAVGAPKRLGQAKETAVQELEEMLPGGVPSRFKDIAPPPPGADPAEWSAGAVMAAERSKFAQALGPTQIDIPSLGQSMTLREANDLLSQRGEVLSGRVPLDPRFRFREPKQAYAALAQDIEGGIAAHGGPEALTKWKALQDAYKVGRAEIKPFQQTGAYQPGQQEGEAQLNLVQVASWMRNPKNAAWLIDRVGRERYDALVNEITRGAGPLAVDVTEAGLGRAADAARQSFGRGTNTGSVQAIGVPLRTIIPGIGRQYAGQQPYSLPPALQAILDVVLQKSGGPALTPETR